MLELSGIPSGNDVADAGSLLDARVRELRAELDEARGQERLQEEADW
jgi:hypothetical protein